MSTQEVHRVRPVASGRRLRPGSAMVVVFVIGLVALGCVFLLWEVTKKFDAGSSQMVQEENTVHAVSQVVDWLKAHRDNRFYFYIGTQTWTWTDDKNNNQCADFDEGTLWQPTPDFDTNGNGIPDFGEPGVNPVKWGDSEIYLWSRLLSGQSGEANFQYICAARTWHRFPNSHGGAVGDLKTGYWVQEMADVRRRWVRYAAQIDAALMLQVNDNANQSHRTVNVTLDGTGAVGDKVNGLDHGDAATGNENQLNGSGNDKLAISLNDGFDLTQTINGHATIGGVINPATGEPWTQDRPSSQGMLDALIATVEAATPKPLAGGTYNKNDGTFGTPDKWAVVRITGGSASFSGQMTGYGILLIEADSVNDIDVKFSGGAGWEGIVLVVGKNGGTVPPSGGLSVRGSPGKDTRLLGSTILYAQNNDGNDSNISGAVSVSGTPTINYSADAVSRALQFLPPLDRMNFRLLTASESFPTQSDRGNMTTDIKMAENNGFSPLTTPAATTTTTTTTTDTSTTGGTTTSTGSGNGNGNSGGTTTSTGSGNGNGNTSSSTTTTTTDPAGTTTTTTTSSTGNGSGNGNTSSSSTTTTTNTTGTTTTTTTTSSNGNGNGNTSTSTTTTTTDATGATTGSTTTTTSSNGNGNGNAGGSSSSSNGNSGGTTGNSSGSTGTTTTGSGKGASKKP